MYINAGQVEIGDYVLDVMAEPNEPKAFFVTDVFFEDDDPNERVDRHEVKLEMLPQHLGDGSFATGYIVPIRHIMRVIKTSREKKANV